jgi:hypothetical protein
MRSIILALLACGATGLGSMYIAKVACDLPEPATFELIATTATGHVYISGVGSDCREAARGAYIPANAFDVTCRRVD